MGNDRVGEQLIEGVFALGHLLRQLERALDEANPPLKRDVHGDDDSVGFYFTRDEQYRQEFWCGMVYSEPQYLVFQYTQAMRSRMGVPVGDQGIDKYPRHPETEDELKKHWRILPFRERDYFLLDVPGQIREIKAFIHDCLATVTPAQD